MKMWSIYTRECYPDVKENTITKFAGKQMELQTAVLDEVIQAQKDKYRISLIGRRDL